MNPTERDLVAACGCRYVQIFKTNSHCMTVVDIECGGGIKCLFSVRNGESETKNSGLQKDLALLTAGSKQVRTPHTWISRVFPTKERSNCPPDSGASREMLMSVTRLEKSFNVTRSVNTEPLISNDTSHLSGSCSCLGTTGMFCSGAGAQPAGLWLQSERRERVQHGPVHPAAG